MKNLTILNSKQLKQIKQLLKDQFNAVFDFSKYATLISPKNKIYIANKGIFTDKDLNLNKLRINSIGMYFAHLKNNELRLSIEGSQLIGPIAKKNIVELTEKELEQWIQGYDLDKPTKTNPPATHPCQDKQKDQSINKPNNNSFIIVKHNNDYIGCGKVKDNKILNYVPKTRRIRIK